MSLNRFNRSIVSVLCAAVILAIGCGLPVESEAAARRVRRAPIRTGTARTAAKTPPMFARGAGTQQSPYVVATTAHLTAFAASVSKGTDYAGKYVRLGANIDLKNTVWASIGAYSSGNSRSFKGFFDGAGFAIYNMGVGNGGRPSGPLFGALDGAELNNVSLQFAEVGGDSNIGAIAGFMAGGSLKNCMVSGTVEGHSAVGGIVGSALNGVITNCNFSGNVIGDSGVGGIAGAVDHTTIHMCAVSARVDGSTDVGGFVGGILDGTVTHSQAGPILVSGGHNVGGSVGNIIEGGRINKVSLNGQVVGNSNVGGVAGHMTAGLVLACSVSGSVKGRENAGGIAGELTAGEVRDCESAADVDGMNGLGGIAGLMSGGKIGGSVNRGVISGGEAVGGVVGNFAGGDLDFSSNRSTGRAKGYMKTGPFAGVQSELPN